VGSNETSTDEVTEGNVPGNASELSRHDVPANATPSSPAQPPAPAHESRTKIVRAKLRSSMSRREIVQVSNFDAKPRSAASPEKHGGDYHPAPTPLLMNAGTGLYNSDYTQPFRNQKKTPGP